MSNWVFVALLHNLSLQEPIENSCVAFVPGTDDRVTSLTKTLPVLQRIISGFTDQFGRNVSPSLMIVRQNAPLGRYLRDALIGFRNAIAICSIVKAWEGELVSKVNLNTFKYSNYFDLYPLSVGNDGETILINSLGIDRPEMFVGQISPKLASSYRVTGKSIFYDIELLNAILLVWKGRFLKHRVREWRSRVLFRSLEMAFHASTIPFENSSTIYDYGAKIALWVSAFEVLVRSKTEHANRDKVLNLLSSTPLYAPKLNQKLYELGKKKRTEVTLPQHLYAMLHLARNNFLHGNPVEERDIYIERNEQYHHLTTAAPIIYKLALQAFLKIPKHANIDDYDMTDYANVRNFEESIVKLATSREGE